MPIYQLLVRVKDKRNLSDPILDAKLTKRGDVIHAADENHVWGTQELINPEWRIIKVDLKKDEVESLLAPEPPPDLLKQYQMLRKRNIKLDLDGLGIALDVDEQRSDSTAILKSTDVKAAFELKTKLPEPDEIGPKDESIGPK